MWRRLSNALYKKQEVHILVLGLDNSGKSSLIQHMKPKKVVAHLSHKRWFHVDGKLQVRDKETFEATPTVGFQTEEFQASCQSSTKFPIFWASTG